MQRALDFDEEESDESEGESSRSTTPVPNLKRESGASENADVKRQKTSKLRDSLLYSDFSGDEAAAKKSPESQPADDNKDIAEEGKDEMEIDDEIDDEEDNEEDDEEGKYGSTETPFRPELVYEEIEPRAGTVLDVTRLQDLIKDDEDMQLVRKLLSTAETSPIKHPHYWA